MIESELKPRFVKPPPEDLHWNYIVDISSKWYRSYFYFCAQYRCPAPNCISEFFEVKFARLEYVGKDRFNLSYMRHTEQWWELYTDLPLESCFLDIIRSDPNFTRIMTQAIHPLSSDVGGNGQIDRSYFRGN